jgi:two-component system sensor histidine kinase ResE
LTSIRGFAEAIADNVAPDPSKAAEVLVAESSRLERLIRDLLDLAYLEARRFSLRLDVMDAVSCVQQTATSFTMEARQSMVDITFYADQDTILALADGDRLSQVVANLIQNALKFTKSKIVIMVSDSINPLLVENQSYKNSALYKNYGKKKYFYIHVEDDGLGIAEEDLPHVFERLYTSDRRVLREGKGTGLGLAIVKELIEAMGGEVFVTSPVENNRGTVFIVALECYEPTSEEG